MQHFTAPMKRGFWMCLQGICHRDLSGNNILLKWVKVSEASKPYPVVYVCDFGMAKVGCLQANLSVHGVPSLHQAVTSIRNLLLSFRNLRFVSCSCRCFTPWSVAQHMPRVPVVFLSAEDCSPSSRLNPAALLEKERQPNGTSRS